MRSVLFILSLLFAGNLHAQTVTQRAVEITTAIKGSALTSQQQQDVAVAFAEHYPQFFAPVDPQNPTNAEYAACFVEAMRYHTKEVLRAQGRFDAQTAAQPTIETAGDTAAAVMDP